MNECMVNQCPEWTCYLAEFPLAAGHVVFVNPFVENWPKTYSAAQDYGRGMVEMGLCLNYHVFSVDVHLMHVIPVYRDTPDLVTCMEIICKN